MSESGVIPPLEDRELLMERCRDVKNGRITLLCELVRGHGGWHRAVYTDRQEVVYLGAHHLVEMTETVTWEPLDHIAEAVRHITAKPRPPTEGPVPP